jgi:signal transduction histidine kinase
MDTRMAGPGEAESGSVDELRSVAQLKMLQSLARRLNRLNDVQQIGDAITAELRTLIDYHNCRVHLLQPEGHILLPVSFRGELSEYQGETFDALITEVGEGVTGHVAATGKSYYTPDAAKSDLAVQIPGTTQIDESMLVVPLSIGDRVIGTLALSKLGIDQFDGEDMRLLEVLASHAAVAIENARLLEREREAAVTARELLKLSQSLTQAQEPAAVLEEALSSVPALVACSGLQAYLRHPETGAFRLVGLRGFDGEQTAKFRDQPDVVAEVAAQFLLSTEEPFILPKEVLAEVPSEYNVLIEPRDVLVAPLKWEPRGFGALVIIASGPHARFSERELQLTRGIADITSLALGNAARFTEQRVMSEHLRRVDEMKNTFLQAVSHDLRTPLTSVLGMALTLQQRGEQLSAAEHRDLLDRLADNARKLHRILSDLLDVERLQRGVVTPNLQEIDLGALVRQVVSEVEVGSRSVRMEVDSVRAVVDPAKVERIVENLLVNAARHTPPDSTVWVRAEANPDGAVIVVEDDGPGVPEDAREIIFEPFQQGSIARDPSPGSGVGLSLVARLAELHGGRAWVETRAGGGASFRVFLPG